LRIEGKPAGAVYPPASKSISHRALICAALSGGGLISHLAENDDTEATIRCLTALGAKLLVDGDTVGVADRATGRGSRTLDCGESGSTLRFMLPIAAAFGGHSEFTGRGRLMERPLSVYEDCFPAHGVTISRSDGKVLIDGTLTAGEFTVDGGISSQFITGLLFALPLLEGDSELKISGELQSVGYVDLTLDELERSGIKIDNNGYKSFFIKGGQKYRAADRAIEADFSGAAFFLTAAALGCGVETCGLSLSSRQGDRGFLDVLEKMGCAVSQGKFGLKVDGTARHGATIDVSDIPDLVPPMAALMALTPGVSRIENAARLRIKESDRLATVTEELTRMGANITEGADYLEICGAERLHGADCRAHNDHRIAMMCAVASILADGDVTIDDPDCVKKSYPNFWKDFARNQL
jgi:3-phosphoshikimate 1-carboxyvinyltransferase